MLGTAHRSMAKRRGFVVSAQLDVFEAFMGRLRLVVVGSILSYAGIARLPEDTEVKCCVASLLPLPIPALMLSSSCLHVVLETLPMGGRADTLPRMQTPAIGSWSSLQLRPMCSLWSMRDPVEIELITSKLRRWCEASLAPHGRLTKDSRR